MWLWKHRRDLLKVGILVAGSLVCAIGYDEWRWRQQRKDGEAASSSAPLPAERVDSDALMFRSDDFIAPVSLLTKLKLDRTSLDHYIRSRFRRSTIELIDKYAPPAYPDRELLNTLLGEFFMLLVDMNGQRLYDPQRFVDVKLSKDTLSALESQTIDPMLLNRMLLEDAYSNEIWARYTKRETTTEIAAVSVPELLDDFKNNKGETYLGKRYLIRGRVGEFVVYNDTLQLLPTFPQKISVMLVSSDNLPDAVDSLPFDREHSSPLSSPEWQAHVQFEGVYCTFMDNFSAWFYDERILYSEEKKALMASCEIVGFEKGITRATRDRSLSNDHTDYYKGHEQDRVIAVNCVEQSASP